MESSDGQLVEYGTSVRTPSGRAYPAFVKATIGAGIFELVPELFGVQFRPLLSVGISDLKQIEVIKERGFTLLRVQAKGAQVFTLRSDSPTLWLKAFQSFGVPVAGVLETNPVERSVGVLQSFARRMLSGAAAIFALLTLALLLLLAASTWATHWVQMRNH